MVIADGGHDWLSGKSLGESSGSGSGSGIAAPPASCPAGGEEGGEGEGDVSGCMAGFEWVDEADPDIAALLAPGQSRVRAFFASRGVVRLSQLGAFKAELGKAEAPGRKEMMALERWVLRRTGNGAAPLY